MYYLPNNIPINNFHYLSKLCQIQSTFHLNNFILTLTVVFYVITINMSKNLFEIIILVFPNRDF